MKIERLIGIITILLQRKKVTASYLAEKFNVSKRTIYRDIIDIGLAGIPVITSPGIDGGIMIEENYKIDKTLFTEKELQSVFAGLLSLDSVAADNKYQRIIEKFSGDSAHDTNNHILIDLSSHYKQSLAPKIELIRQAIEQLHKITFDYYSKNCKKQILIDPYLIVFQWSNWYVLGCESDHDAFRLYKLNRLWDPVISEQTFDLREIPQETLDFNGYFTEDIQAVILFEKEAEYRLVEEYGTDSYSCLDDGKLRFEFPFTNKEYLLEWVLSFGEKAELIEPREYRTELKSRAEQLAEKYSKC